MSIYGQCDDKVKTDSKSTESGADLSDYAKKNYIDTKVHQLIKKSGDGMSGNLYMGGRLVVVSAISTNLLHTVNKQYIDSIASEQVSK